MGLQGKLRTVQGGYSAYCPGCQEWHIFYADRWKFNGNFDAPSFTPSLVVPGCHSYLTDGVWNFLGDSTHELSGKKVALEVPDRPM